MPMHTKGYPEQEKMMCNNFYFVYHSRSEKLNEQFAFVCLYLELKGVDV